MYGTAEETIKNAALLDAALHVIEQHAETETPEEIAEFIRIPLIAKQIACNFDDDHSPADVLKALEILIPILKERKTIKGMDEGFELYMYVDNVLDNIKDDASLNKDEDDEPEAASVLRARFLNVLSEFRSAMDRINAWVEAGRFLFGRPPRRSQYTALAPDDCAGPGFRGKMNWMDNTSYLHRVAGLIRQEYVQGDS